MNVRTYGRRGPLVVLLHGGPGAPGYMAPVARALSATYRVVEPLQRRSTANQPLTVARHVADLVEVLARHCAPERPAVVGSSWGAMLALAYAADHARTVAGVALVGCGTFDRAARARMVERREACTDDATRQRVAALCSAIADPDQRLAAVGEALVAAYSHDPLTTALELERCDDRGRQESWDDMVRLQDRGVYPQAFAAIDVPVLMLHGAVDPHPGPMIRDGLLAHIPHLRYVEWPRCGHYPWLERAVRAPFFDTLRAWLAEVTATDPPQ